MNAFLVDLENKPGALADIAEALGAKGVNITGVSGATCGDSGRAAITTNDEVATRQVLESRKASFQELEVTEASLKNEPGSLGQAARRLAAAGVNIEAIFPTGMSGNEVSVGFVTNNPVALAVIPTVPARKKTRLPSKNGDAADCSTSFRTGCPGCRSAPSRPASDSTSTSSSLSQSPAKALPRSPARTSSRCSRDPRYTSVLPSVDR